MFRKFTKKNFLHLNLPLTLKFREDCPKTTVNLSLILPGTFSQVFMALYIVLKMFRQFFFDFAAESIRYYPTQ